MMAVHNTYQSSRVASNSFCMLIGMVVVVFCNKVHSCLGGFLGIRDLSLNWVHVFDSKKANVGF